MTALELKRKEYKATEKQRLDAFLLELIQERDLTHHQIVMALIKDRFGKVTREELSLGLQRLSHRGKIRNNGTPRLWMVN